MTPPERAVTALMPLRNHHREFLFRAIGSIVTQTSPDWRLLIIVEPEDRRYFDRLLEEPLRDARISIVDNEGRKLSGAMNTGMRHAVTSFVAILLSDDMWSADTVEVLNGHIRRFPDVDFFHSSRVFIDENDVVMGSVHHSRESFTLEHFLASSPVKHLLCWRREKALAIGGMDESLNCVGPDDYDFPWSMAEQGARFQAIREPLYQYRDHRDAARLTTHLPLSVHLKETRTILRKHGASRKQIEERLAHAKASYLRQCLYKNRLDMWVKRLLAYDARRGWRETYR